MPLPTFNETQQMLTLAFLCYPGFQNKAGDWLSDTRLREILEGALRTLKPVKDQWTVVWGPSTFRAPLTILSDSSAYVVRNTHNPSQYVIAIRGTNPISLFDWTFGDFQVSKLTPWRASGGANVGDAQISLSTSLGLTVLQNLKSGDAASEGGTGLFRTLHDTLSEMLDVLEQRVIEPALLELAGNARELRAAVREELEQLRQLMEHLPGAELRAALEEFRADRTATLRTKFLLLLRDAVEVIPEEAQHGLMALLESSAVRRNQARPGITLQQYLNAAAIEAKEGGQPPLDVIVVGHSKGGALTPPLALWLQETQGEKDGSMEGRWNVDDDATLRCYSFAGPPPGNRAFSDRFGTALGDRSVRVFNTLDFAPRAWIVKTADNDPSMYLQQLPGLYWPAVPEVEERDAGLAELVEDISARVGPMDYAHVGGSVVALEGTLDEKKTTLLEQAIHQHVNAYIIELGLEEHMSLLDLINFP